MLEYDNNKPMYLQVIDDLKKRIINQNFHVNSKFPSTRELAIEYSINPNTASRVYRELELQGICYTKKGVGTFLSNSEELVSTLKQSMAKNLLHNFLSNMDDLGFEKEEIINLIETGGSKVK